MTAMEGRTIGQSARTFPPGKHQAKTGKVGPLRIRPRVNPKEKVTKDLLVAKVMPTGATGVAEDGEARAGILAQEGGKSVRPVTDLPADP